ncbi:hypothetical protein [uncultured Bosea sp.]|uniref:hypothetical protein n=1 Tax=uncultured Bosea sp. TaxID=211457 RepID=UPI00263AC55E|nr:hypothetical protein [uncultured Bosea sp.]
MSAGLLLDDRGPQPYGSAEHDIACSQPHEITTVQLAVDCEIEHSQISHAPIVLQPRPDGPDVTRL